MKYVAGWETSEISSKSEMCNCQILLTTRNKTSNHEKSFFHSDKKSWDLSKINTLSVEETFCYMLRYSLSYILVVIRDDILLLVEQ